MDVPIRVLVVDDSVVVRKILSDILSTEPGFEVVGTAPNGRIALQKVTQLPPDAITLDIEMPVMDGLETLAELRKAHSRLPVVMCSTLTSRGATATLDALTLGARDYVTKPSTSAEIEALRTDLTAKLRALCGKARPAPRRVAPAAMAASAPPRRPSTPPGRIESIVIGISTGGPNALAEVIPQLPGDLPVPVLVVQHMPPVFTRMLAERLDAASALRVTEAIDGQPVRAGEVLIAPGGQHLTVVDRDGHPRVHLLETPPENSCRPAVDVLFRSAVEVWGSKLLGAVLTGMGQDGYRGAEKIVAAGGRVVAQDEATSVVYGMPAAVVEHGLADAVLPLSQVADTLAKRASVGRVPTRIGARPA